MNHTGYACALTGHSISHFCKIMRERQRGEGRGWVSERKEGRKWVCEREREGVRWRKRESEWEKGWGKGSERKGERVGEWVKEREWECTYTQVTDCL